MKITNEERARLLCCSDCKNYVCYTNKKRCQALEDILTMAQWKDEQFSIERKQLIEKANQAVTQAFENGAIFKKQQLIKEACERLEEYFAPDGSMVPENIRLWRDLQRVIKGE